MELWESIAGGLGGCMGDREMDRWERLLLSISVGVRHCLDL